MKKLLHRIPENAANWLLDWLSAWLLTWGVGLVVLPILGWHPGLWQTAAFAGAAMALCALFSRRVIAIVTGAALLLGAVGATAWLLWGGGWTLPDLWERLSGAGSGLWGWVLQGFSETSPYAAGLWPLLAGSLLLLPVGVLSFLFYRLFYSLIPLAAVCAGGIVYTQLMDTPEQYAAAAVLLTVAVMSLAKASRRQKKKAAATGKLPEAAMRFAALLLALVTVLPALLLASAPDGKWVSRTMHRFTGDVGDLFSYYFRGGGSSPGFAVSDLVPGQEVLGGDLDQSGEVVIRIQTDTPYLLMGSVYDAYDGRRWYDGGAVGSFRLDGAAWGSLRREAFATTNPRGGRRARDVYESITKTVKMELRPNEFYLNYFVAGQPLSWSFGAGCGEASFNNQGEIFTNDGTYLGVNYAFESRIFKYTDPDFETRLTLLETFTSVARDPLYSTMSKRYTGLPDSLPQSVRDTAAAITLGAETPAAKAFAIKNWLAKNCTYVTDPGRLPGGRDFVEYFLETREGYCTYYASAMTVLARCAGLPARYVTGFLMRENDGLSGGYVVTEDSAHAWCEVYLSGIGWVPFDAAETGRSAMEAARPQEETPASSGSAAGWELPPDIEELMRQLEQQQAAQAQKPPVEKPEPEPEPETPERTPWRMKRPWLPPLILAVLFGAFALIRTRWLLADEDRLVRRAKRRRRDGPAQAEVLFTRIRRQLGAVSLAPETGETLHDWGERLDKLFPAKYVDPPVLAMERWYYGEIPPEPEDVAALARLSARLEREVRGILGTRQWFRQRVLGIK